MRVPLEIATRNVELTDEIESLIREKAKKLDKFFDRLISCRVMVEVPHRSKQSGITYLVRIDMTVPGGELVVKREPHEDLHVAITRAFETATRQIKEHAERQRGEVKIHVEKPVARVSKIFKEEGYGFITTPEGAEIYFHRNAVLEGKFDEIDIGSIVTFVEETGDKGAQATTVTLQ